MANFSSMDLNLLRVFDALFEERSVTRAGSRLHVTQSAVSHALARLSDILDDELFIKSPDGMTPTAKARAVGPRLRAGPRFGGWVTGSAAGASSPPRAPGRGALRGRAAHSTRPSAG